MLLPLDKFAVLRSGTRAEAHASIRTRSPTVHDLAVQSGSQDWRIDINAMSLGEGRVIATRGSAFQLSGEDDGLVRLFVPLRKKIEIRMGSQSCFVLPGSALVASRGALSRLYGEGASILIAMFPHAMVSNALECFSGENRQPEGGQSLFRHGPALDMARRYLLSMVDTIDGSSDVMVRVPRFWRAQEELLLLHLAQVVASPGHDKGGRKGPSSSLLGRAVAFIHAHLSDDIGSMAVAQAAGCSLRNLQLLFRKEHGRTITAFIRDLRLRAARERLLESKGAASVTAVALECGFSHLSDFARHYREAFGETPSGTAHKARVRMSGQS